MKSYDEIYQNVLRRRDEQMAKKRRRIAVAGSVVLPAVMLSAAVGVGVAAWQWGLPAGSGENERNPLSGNADISADEMQQQTADVQPPVQLIDNRLIFMENGENIDITDMISEKIPYIYEYTDVETGLVSYAIAGGTPENYGWAKFSMYEQDTETPENSKWNNYSCNTFTADRQDRKWYKTAITQLSEKPENIGIILWSMTERAWELESSVMYNTLKVTVAQDSLDGYDVYLDLDVVTHIPTEEAAYYSAERIVLTVKYYVGGHHYFCSMYMDTLNEEFSDRLIAGDNLKILRLEDGGRIRHVLMLRNYSEEDKCWHTVFIALDSISGSDVQLYTFNGEEDHTVNTGDYRIVNKDGTDVLMTSVEGSVYTIAFDFTELSFTYSPTDQAWDTVGIAQDSLGGYTACLELKNVTHMPTADKDYYSAEDAVITVSGPDGSSAYASVKAANVYGDFFYTDISAGHIDESLKIYRIEQDGEAHYVLALRSCHLSDDEGYGEESEVHLTLFFALEPECFETGELRMYESGTPNRHRSDFIIFADGDFSVDGNTLVDTVTDASTVHYYEFDPENLIFRWHYE